MPFQPSTYVVQASPLTRLVLPEYQQECLDDPKVLESNTPFLVKIPRPTGMIELWHNKPTLASTLIPRTKDRKITEDETTPLVRWLTEDDEPETDIYGVVAVPIQEDIADAIMTMIHEGDDKKRIKLIDETRKRMAKGISEAREKADKRVIKACGRMNSIVVQTVQDMKKNGKGIYSPSYSEALALTIMKDSLALRRKPDERATEMMKAAMDQMEQPV